MYTLLDCHQRPLSRNAAPAALAPNIGQHVWQFKNVLNTGRTVHLSLFYSSYIYFGAGRCTVYLCNRNGIIVVIRN